MAANTGSLLADLKADFPWLDQIGFSVEFFQQLVANAASSAEIITSLRQTPQYKQRFPGLWRQDGSIRMTEAQYLARENDFRQVANQYGYGDNFKTPASFVGLFDSEQDPNEFKDRLDTYKQIQNAGQATKDAFYVYAGLQVSDDDLFEAVVDPAAAQRLTDEYNQRVASSQFDYVTWITRATEVGQQRVAKTLQDLAKTGAVTGTAVQAVLRTDPNFARTIMDALYHGGDVSPNGQTLNLQELLSSFEYASIGAAATQAGLTLPTKERIAEIRAAGIDRARASQAYVQFGQNKGVYDAAVKRTGGGDFGQQDFESAAFLGDAAAAARLQAGLARETAAGQEQGQFRMEATANGIAQKGLRSTRV